MNRWEGMEPDAVKTEGGVADDSIIDVDSAPVPKLEQTDGGFLVPERMEADLIQAVTIPTDRVLARRSPYTALEIMRVRTNYQLPALAIMILIDLAAAQAVSLESVADELGEFRKEGGPTAAKVVRDHILKLNDVWFPVWTNQGTP